MGSVAAEDFCASCGRGGGSSAILETQLNVIWNNFDTILMKNQERKKGAKTEVKCLHYVTMG